MFIHSQTSVAEFIDHLRDDAIQHNKSPQYIDAIDRLDSFVMMEDDLESLGDELYEMEKSKNDLHSELEDLLTVLDNHLPSNAGKAIENAMKIAWSAVERHNEK